MKTSAAVSDGTVSLAPMLTEHVTSEYVDWLNDEDVVKFTEVRGHHDIASTQNYVQSTIDSADATLWRILIDAQKHVGNIRFSKINQIHHRAEIALLIGDRNSWGRGIGTAAIKLVSQIGFEQFEFHKLSAGVLAPNVGSRVAFERAGFHLEAVFSRHSWLDGDYHDQLVMAQFSPVTP